MEIGNLLLIVIAALAGFVVIVRTVLAIIVANAPVLTSPIFKVYKNNNYREKYRNSNIPLYSFEYRCILSKDAIAKYGDLNILGFGHTPEEAYLAAKEQFQNCFVEDDE